MRDLTWLNRYVAIAALALALVFTASPADAQGPAAENAGQVRVVTYNLLNLFDVFDDPYTRDETTQVKPRKEIELIAKTIRSLKPDLICVQEVENEQVLRAMAGETLGGMGYEYVAAGLSNDGRGIRVGLISRLPIVSQTSFRFTRLKLDGDERQWHFARDLTRFRVQATESRLMDVYVVHFKSKRTTGNDPQSTHWRQAEATAVRRIIKRSQASFAGVKPWVILAGDFNDTLDSKPMQALLEAKDGTASLIDVHSHIPESERVTYLKEPYRSTIDFILAGPDLAKRVVKGSAKVINGDGDASDETKAMLEGSDHAPVAATFDLTD